MARSVPRAKERAQCVTNKKLKDTDTAIMAEQQVREFISMNDLAQYEEEQLDGYRGELDANAAIPPLPHDVYLFNVRYAEDDPAKRWEKRIAPKTGKLFFMANVKVESKNNTSAAYDGRSWTENVMTMVNTRGVTGAQALLQGLGVDTLLLNTHGAQIRALDEQLSGGSAMVGMETDWQARIFDKDAAKLDKDGKPVVIDGKNVLGQEKWQLRGMRNFPKLIGADGQPTGEYSHIIGKDDGYKMKDGTPIVDEVRAFNVMRRWVPANSVVAAETQDQPQDAGETVTEETIAATAPVSAPVTAPVTTAAMPIAPAIVRPAGRPAPPVRRVAQPV